MLTYTAGLCKWVSCLGANAGAQPVSGPRGSTNNQLDGVPKRGVQQSSQGVAQPHGDLLRRERQDGGQRDDGEEVEREDGRGSPVELTGDDAERHDDEQEVDIVCVSRAPVRATFPNPCPPNPSRRKSAHRRGGGNSLLRSVTLVTCHVEAEYLTTWLAWSVPGVLRLWKKKCFQSMDPPSLAAPRPLRRPVVSEGPSPAASPCWYCGMEEVLTALRKLTLAGSAEGVVSDFRFRRQLLSGARCIGFDGVRSQLGQATCVLCDRDKRARRCHKENRSGYQKLSCEEGKARD